MNDINVLLQHVSIVCHCLWVPYNLLVGLFVGRSVGCWRNPHELFASGRFLVKQIGRMYYYYYYQFIIMCKWAKSNKMTIEEDARRNIRIDLFRCCCSIIVSSWAMSHVVIAH